MTLWSFSAAKTKRVSRSRKSVLPGDDGWKPYSPTKLDDVAEEVKDQDEKKTESTRPKRFRVAKSRALKSFPLK